MSPKTKPYTGRADPVITDVIHPTNIYNHSGLFTFNIDIIELPPVDS
jgi:hypothetical protein